MAEQFKLTPEEVRTLRDVQPHINVARDTIERLEKIGVDVTEQRARLEQAVQIRDGLLREFSPTGVPPRR